MHWRISTEVHTTAERFTRYRYRRQQCFLVFARHISSWLWLCYLCSLMLRASMITNPVWWVGASFFVISSLAQHSRGFVWRNGEKWAENINTFREMFETSLNNPSQHQNVHWENEKMSYWENVLLGNCQRTHLQTLSHTFLKQCVKSIDCILLFFIICL